MGGFSPGPGEGGGGGGGLWSIISTVIGLLFGGAQSTGDLIGDIQLAYGLAWFNTVTAEQFLHDAIASVIHTLGEVIGAIGSALAHIITDILHGRLKDILQVIKDLLKALRNVLGPLIAWLKRLQQIQRQLQMQYLRQFVDIIQRARKILAVFRLLHLHFADKLDLYLAKLEGDVGAKWAKILEHVNAVTHVLDQIIDPSLLLRPGGLLGSLGVMIGAVSAAVKGLTPGQLLCLPGPTYAAPVTQPWPVTEALTVNDVKHNTGDYAQFHAARDAALRNYAIDLGVNPLV